jgi:integrase
MRKQYQGGYIRRAKRRKGPDVWEYLWREETAEGKRIRHTLVVGPVTKYRTKEAASNAVNGLRMQINQECFRLRRRQVLVSEVIDHFYETELFNPEEGYSPSTKRVMPDVIKRWIRPQWGSFIVRDVRPGAVRYWLRNLSREDGERLASSTKAHVKRVMQRLFSHAIYCEWLEQGKNVMKLVKQSAQRLKEPVPFEPEEVYRFLDALNSPYREMIILILAFGLRRSELFALKWRDFNFEKNELTVERNIVYSELGICKTRASRATMPMTPLVAIQLCVWRKFTAYKRDEDWVFPSIRDKGRIPMSDGSPMEDIIKPAARKAGITKRVHWHAFRYTYATWLVASGADIGVMHELMRHASARTTIDFYVKASKRLGLVIQERIQKLLFPAVRDDDLMFDEPDIPIEAKEKQRREAQERVSSVLFGIDQVDQSKTAEEARMDNDDYVM